MVFNYISQRNFFRSLLVRMALVVGLGTILFGGGLLHLVNRAIEEYVVQNVEHDLLRDSRSAAQIFDDALGGLMQQGMLDNRLAVRIARVKSLAEFDDFLRVNQLQGCVVSDSGALLFSSSTLPQPLLEQCTAASEGRKQMFNVEWAGQQFFLYRFHYDSWQQSIILIEDQAAYEALSQRLYELRTLLVGLLLMMIAILTLILYYNIGRPIQQIIEALQSNHTPRYQGVLEFQYLSESFVSIMSDLKKASQTKDEFLASMSHELRTPLTTIIGNTEHLLESGEYGRERCPQQDAREVLRSVESAGRAQLALVNDILDMSKIESGKFQIDEFPYDLAVLLDDLEKIFRVRVADAGLVLQIEQRNQEECLLLGDAQRIAQILINLLGNAIKFTSAGSVSLTTSATPQQLIFTVEDSGIGISAEVVEGLFQQFKQADGSISRRFGGTGLGLYISKNLAALMGGEIEVSSREGVGSTFRLLLPYKATTTPAQQARGSQHRRAVINQRFSGHVLIAEDTPELQLLERRILQGLGLTVEVATNGREAVEKALAQRFDLILMDMQMPEMDGIDATLALQRAGNRTPIIPLTANVMQRHRDAFANAGCEDFLSKPIDRAELARLLNKYLLLEQDRHALDQLGIEDRRKRVRRAEEIAVIDDERGEQKPPRRLRDQLARGGVPVQDQSVQNRRVEDQLVQDQPSLNQPSRNQRAEGQPSVATTPPAGAEEEVDEELMAIFVASNSGRREQLQSLLGEKNWGEVRAIAHAIKGSAASFGYPELSRVAETVQHSIDEGRLDEVEGEALRLCAELDKVLLP